MSLEIIIKHHPHLHPLIKSRTAKTQPPNSHHLISLNNQPPHSDHPPHTPPPTPPPHPLNSTINPVVRMSLYAPPLFHFCFPLLPSNLSSQLLTQRATSYMRCKELYGSNVSHLVIPHDRRSCKGLAQPLERASSRLPAPLRLHTSGVYKSSGRTSKTGQSSSTVPANTTQICPSPPPNSPL
jgi:hypothetical protein